MDYDGIIEWMKSASFGDMLNLTEQFKDISHTQVLDVCKDINDICVNLDFDIRVRKAWKSLEVVSKE